MKQIRKQDELTQSQIDEVTAFDAKARAAEPSKRTLRYNYLTVEEDGGVTVHHLAVHPKHGALEIARFPIDGSLKGLFRQCGKHGIAGWLVFWTEADYLKPRYNYYNRDYGMDWSEDAYTPSFDYYALVNPEVLAQSRFRYSQYASQKRFGVINWLSLYAKDSRLELLAKAGLWCLCSAAGLKFAAKHREYVRTHLAELKDCRYTPREIEYAIVHHIGLADARDTLEYAASMGRVLGRLKLGLDYGAVRKSLAEWDADEHEYRRYLEYSKELGYEMRCEGVLYPRFKGRAEFAKRLEELERKVCAKRAREERERRREWARRNREAAKREAEEQKRLEALMAGRVDEIRRFQSSLDRTATIDFGAYRCVLAKSQDELLKEGRKMGNCVGHGHYGRGIALGKTIIVMLKRGNASFVDIEIDRTDWSVRQCYRKFNEKAPDECWEIAKRVCSFLKKRASKASKGKAA